MEPNSCDQGNNDHEQWIKPDNGGTSNFSCRNSDVFDSLKNLEDAYLKKADLEQSSADRHGNLIVPYVEKEKHKLQNDGPFKMPVKCAPKNNKTHPRHQPDKWTYYNLSDVTEEQMSEKSNKTAALSFLSELREQKQRNVKEAVDSSCDLEKPIFNSQKNKKSPSTDEPTAQKRHKGSVLVMPEYVVGGPTKPCSKKTTITSICDTNTRDSVSLSHLDDETDDNKVDEQATSKNHTVTFNKKKNKSRKTFRPRTVIEDG